MITSKNLLGICPNLDRYLLPVDIEHHARREKAHKLSGVIANWLQLRPAANESEARIYNKKTIAYAIRLVKKGGIVALCPEGIRSIRNKWFPGIGHLTHGVGPQPKKYVVFAHARGTSGLDYFRLIPFMGYILPKITITFSKPLPLNAIFSNAKEPKTIKNYLEQKYNTWAKTIH